VGDPVTLAELKTYARINHDAEDDLLQLMLDAAVRQVEDETGWITTQTAFTLELDSYPEDGVAHLPRFPLVSVTGVTNTDDDGNTTAVTGYHLAGNKVVLPDPTTTCRKLAINFLAGDDDIPDPMKVAVYALATLKYKYRETTTTDAISDVPHGYEVIMNTLRASLLVGGQS
jgi:uncharacterized phiE125 gp8 family phage protein